MAPPLISNMLFVFLTLAPYISCLSGSSNFTTSLNQTGTSGPKNQTLYKPLYQAPTNSTPRFINTTLQNTNPLVPAALGYSNSGHSKRSYTPAAGGALPHSTSPRHLLRRDTQAPGTCGPGTPCTNGACCSNSGFCGYSPDFCGTGNCISNCDAKAECGQYGVPGKQNCPLNVCCSQFGFCGTTDEFCGTGCQTAFGGCGPAPKQTCGGQGSLKRSIGYYESWSATRVCDAALPEDLVLDGLTHLNFAFAFFDPTTFKISPMDANTGKLYPRVTALKAKYSGLQVFISIGGWSFNDPGNNPDTRTAFSDMAKTQANRQAFIVNLMSFMATYGFDGIDIDWEYPGADDRGGVPEDTANFVSLVQELQGAFGGLYGLSVTLPASYWYLQHFDVAAMQQYVDWFNVMTYDLHGVWDKPNQFTGPYVRPHTNLTEIDQGLSLLWRAGVDPGKVVMGFGFYGRSFTLSTPSCNTPGCIFSDGGNAGQCSGTVGILTNIEIDRIIAANNLIPHFDKDAAVNWLNWDTNQWVSYDDAITMALKRDYAGTSCLGGTMIWALDQGSDDTNSNYLGVGSGKYAVGVSKQNVVQAGEDAALFNVCYTSFCDEPCKAGFSSVSQMNGQVGDIQFDTSCSGAYQQNLCCPSNVVMGRCSWRGWKGQGLACQPGCADAQEAEVAQNTNHFYNVHDDHGNSFYEDQTCNGAFQSYCCEGFIAPAGSPLDQLNLITGNNEQTTVQDLRKRDANSRDLEVGAWILNGLDLSDTAYGGSVLDKPGVVGVVDLPGSTGPMVGYGAMRTKPGKYGAGNAWSPLGSNGKPQANPINAPNPKFNSNGQRVYGDYVSVSYPLAATTCSVTYTCRYGHGFDEVCDNQRYGITELLGGNTVYDYALVKGPKSQAQWRRSVHKSYRDFGPKTTGSYFGGTHTRCMCEGDEFPMNALVQAQFLAPQVVRQIDGVQNGAQGADFYYWRLAEFLPCAVALAGKQLPPITWKFDYDGLSPTDPRLNNGAGFIRKYGFDSMVPSDRCFAHYGAGGQRFTIPDHGFRAHPGDVMFRSPQMWNGGATQNWKADPATVQAGQLPTSVNSAVWLKRDLEQEFCPPDEPDCEVLAYGQLEERDETPPPPNPTPAEEANWATIHHARFARSRPQPGIVAGWSGPSATVTQMQHTTKPTSGSVPIAVAGNDNWHGKNSSMSYPSLFKRQSDTCVLSDDSFDDNFGDCNCDD